MTHPRTFAPLHPANTDWRMPRPVTTGFGLRRHGCPRPRWWVHNLVAHPLLVVLPPVGRWLHERTAP